MENSCSMRRRRRRFKAKHANRCKGESIGAITTVDLIQQDEQQPASSRERELDQNLSLIEKLAGAAAPTASHDNDTFEAKWDAKHASAWFTYPHSCHRTPGRRSLAGHSFRSFPLKLVLMAIVCSVLVDMRGLCHSRGASIFGALAARSQDSALDSDSVTYSAHSIPFYLAAEANVDEPRTMSAAAANSTDASNKRLARQAVESHHLKSLSARNKSTSSVDHNDQTRTTTGHTIKRASADYDFGFDIHTGESNNTLDDGATFSPLDSSSSALMATKSGQPSASARDERAGLAPPLTGEKWNKPSVVKLESTSTRASARQQQGDNEMSTIESGAHSQLPGPNVARKMAAKSGSQTLFSPLVSKKSPSFSGTKQPRVNVTSHESSSAKLVGGGKSAGLNIKVTIHPRAPVHMAKARYKSSLVQPTSLAIKGFAVSSEGAKQKDRPEEDTNDTNENQTLRIFTNRFKYSEPKKSVKQSAATLNELSARPAEGDLSRQQKLRLSTADGNPLVKSTKRRAARNSLLLAAPSTDDSRLIADRYNSTVPPVPPVPQLPLSNYVNSYAPTTPPFQGSANAGDSILHSFNRLRPNELHGFTREADAPQNTIDANQLRSVESIVRSGFILPQQQRVWPATSQVPMQNIRSLVPTAVALFAQTQGGSDTNSLKSKQLRAFSQLHRLLASQHQHTKMTANDLREPGATLDYATSSVSVPAGVGLTSASTMPQAEQMLAAANQLGVSHLGPASQTAADSGGYMQDYADSRPPPPPPLLSNGMVGPERGEARHPSSGASSNVGHSGHARSQLDNGQGSMQPHSSSESPVGSVRAVSGDRSEERRLIGQQYANEGQPYAQPLPNDYYELPYRGGQAMPNSSASSQSGGGDGGGYFGAASSSHEQYQSSRSSPSHDVYLSAEHKASGGSSLDPFEEIGSSFGTSEYERDLADLDEEFGRSAVFRPSRTAGSVGPAQPSHMYGNTLMSDSVLAYSADRYEPRYHQGRVTRPSSYLGEPGPAGDFPSAAATMSSIAPRGYHHQQQHHSHGSHHDLHSRASPPLSYLADSDLWADSNYDYSPLASFLAPTRQYSPSVGIHWRPRYTSGAMTHGHASESAHRPISAYSTAGGALTPSAYLAAASSASEQPSYNFIPSYTASVPTETVSFTMSPLAAAAAAAATALAAVDKTRHSHNHGWTLTLPRLASALTAAQLSSSAPSSSSALPSASTAASNPQTALVAPGQPAFQYRPTTAAAAPAYLFNPMPIYAIAPRSPGAPLSAAASASTPSILPYAFHPATAAGTPIIAYRPAFTLSAGSAPSPLLATASFAYPFRLPIGGPAAFASSPFSNHHHHLHNHHSGSSSSPSYGNHHHHGPSGKSNGLASGRLLSGASSGGSLPKPFLLDLQFAESKSKSNAPPQGNGGADSSSSGSTTKGLVIKSAGNLTQMARNLSKKMFGSASQLRPQFEAPPANFELLGATGVSEPQATGYSPSMTAGGSGSV